MAQPEPSVLISISTYILFIIGILAAGYALWKTRGLQEWQSVAAAYKEQLEIAQKKNDTLSIKLEEAQEQNKSMAIELERLRSMPDLSKLLDVMTSQYSEMTRALQILSRGMESLLGETFEGESNLS